MLTNEIKNEIHEIKKQEQKIDREELKYKTKNQTYVFQQYKIIRSFGEKIYGGKNSINETDMDQTNSSENMVKFNNKSKSKTQKIRIKISYF